MDRFTPFANNVGASLYASLVAGTIHEDLQAATTFVETALEDRAGQLPPLGLSAPVMTPDMIKENLRKQEQTSSVQVFFPEAWLCWIFASVLCPWRI